MKNLRRKFDLYCYKNRNKGIPNLMLYIVLGTAIVYLMSQMSGNYLLYNILCFNRQLILQGQVWRLITYPLTYGIDNLLLMAVSLFCYYSLGRAMENIWGTLRFNLFYLTGVVMMEVYWRGQRYLPEPESVPQLRYPIPQRTVFASVHHSRQGLDLCPV